MTLLRTLTLIALLAIPPCTVAEPIVEPPFPVPSTPSAELQTLRSVFETRIQKLRDESATARNGTNDVPPRIRRVVEQYRMRLLDLRRHRHSSDDEGEAFLAEQEIARLDTAFPPPPPPPMALPGGLAPGLVLHYEFNRFEADRVVDASAHENHGRVYGAVWSPNGRSGGAYWIEESDEYIAAPSAPSLCLPNALTLSACVRRPLSQHVAMQVISKSNLSHTDYFLRVNPDLTLDAGVRYAREDRPFLRFPAKPNRNTIPEGPWVHLVFTYDGARAATYIDGRLDRETASIAPLAFSDAPLNIGRHAQQGWRYSGMLMVDDVMIWDRALSEVEVLGLCKWIEDTAADAERSSHLKAEPR